MNRQFGLLLLLISLVAAGAEAQNAACNQAREIVAEVKRLAAEAQPDHRHLLQRLATAGDLCPSLGEAWKLAYCSALALGEKADFYRGRAAFNGVKDLTCGNQPPAPRPLPSRVRRKHALVIGVSQFTDPNIRPLKFASKDAQDFAQLLRDPTWGNFRPEDIRLLTDAQATRTNILDALQEIALVAAEDDMVVIFVSSHGSPNEEAGNITGLASMGYILTHDSAADRLWRNALKFQEFADAVSKLRARRKVTFLDTCYSGQVKEGSKGLVVERGVDNQVAARFLSGEGSYVIVSSQSDERSWESEALQNGFFTHFLIQGLRQGTEPPTLRQVFDYLADQVPDAVSRDKKASQHPQMQPLEADTEVRLGVIPAVGAPPPQL